MSERELGDPVEIRFHGRGGQGTVTLAALSVDAAFRSGWQAMGFPAFGTERTGAPVTAFARLSRSQIRDRSEVRRPSVVVVQDQTLLGAVDVFEGLVVGGTVIVNAMSMPEGLTPSGDIAWVPATDLALEHLGKRMTSTAMLGALASATGLLDMDSACAAIRDRFPGELGVRNERLARAAYEATAIGRVAA
ncbi:MAG TPA: 2-oxoacid:acceptor oxidoreductase family protein [Actinomycetota bacterium]|nr:2-oxoacid:acceptor oxidoreductase family protein [Actinomycetota bacterium]